MAYVSESARRKLHGQFLIATKRPVFRKGNTYRFANDESRCSTCITDVHHGLNSSTGEILISHMPFSSGGTVVVRWVSINKVNVCRAQLVLGWVTVSSAGHLSRYVTSQSGQLSLAVPLWIGAMSTTAMMPYGWRVKAGRLCFMCGWQVKLCDPLVTHGPYLSTLEIHVEHYKVLYKFTFFYCP